MSAPEHGPGSSSGARPGGGGAVVASLVADVRAHRWLVLAVIVVALVGAVAATALTPTTYTGRSSLVVSSNNRSPDQDAVLVQGYIDFFSDEAYQAQILAESGVTEPVSLTARAAASSPILVIEATTGSAESAGEVAAAVAVTFRDDINASRAEEQEATAGQLQSRLDARRRADGPESTGVQALRQELLRVEADRTDMLQDLQLDGGVSATPPDPVTNIGLGLIGGVVLGVCAAAGTAAVQRRRRPDDDG